jgi:hypothetical protein
VKLTMYERRVIREQAKVFACMAPFAMVPVFYKYFRRHLTALRLASKAIARREGD